jgi:hypothetical protein
VASGFWTIRRIYIQRKKRKYDNVFLETRYYYSSQKSEVRLADQALIFIDPGGRVTGAVDVISVNYTHEIREFY